MADPRGMPRQMQGGVGGSTLLRLPGRKKGKGKKGKKLATIEQVRALVKGPAPRMKLWDTTGSSAAGFAGTSFELNLGILQASSPSPVQRVGLAIRMHSLELRGCMGISSTTLGDAFNTGRLIVGRWYKDPAATYSGIGSILNTPPLGTIQAPYAPYNYDTGLQGACEFKVLYDELFGVSAGGPGVTTINVKIPLDVRTTYVGNTGALTDINNNLLFMVWVDDSGAIPNPSFIFNARLLWTDEP